MKYLDLFSLEQKYFKILFDAVVICALMVKHNMINSRVESVSVVS